MSTLRLERSFKMRVEAKLVPVIAYLSYMAGKRVLYNKEYMPIYSYMLQDSYNEGSVQLVQPTEGRGQGREGYYVYVIASLEDV